MNKKEYLGHVFNFIVYKRLSVHYLLSASKQHCWVEIITTRSTVDAKVEYFVQAANLTIRWVFPLLLELHKISLCPLHLDLPACFS